MNTTWNVTLNAQLAAPVSVGISSNTILSVDTAAGSWVRQQHAASDAALDYSGDAGRQQPARRLHLPPGGDDHGGRRQPRWTIREFDTLVLRGMGFSAVVIPSNKSFVFSVNQP